MKSTNLFRTILRIFGTIAAFLYILFLIGEGIPLFNDPHFEGVSVYLLFLIFVLGFYYLWKNEVISGIILITWHVLQWLLVFLVWVDGGLTLILGIPIGFFGIAVLIFGLLKRKSMTDS